MRYSTILFDFDYTLADSSKGIVMCFRNVLQSNNFTGITDDEIKRTIGNTLEDSFAILTGIDDSDVLAGLRKEYSQEASIYMSDNTFLFPETKPMLEILKNNGIRIGIISTKYRYRIIEFLELHFLVQKFDIIVGGEDVARHKPDPEGLNFALEQLNSPASETLYVGDSTIDAQTAMNAHVDFIGVTTGATTRQELSVFPHQAIVNGLGEGFIYQIR